MQLSENSVEPKGKGEFETSSSSTAAGSHSGGIAIGPRGKYARVYRFMLRCICLPVFLVFLCVVVFFDSSLVKLVEYNRPDFLMLSCEMLTETGPKFQDSAKRHADILRQYKAEMNQRYLAGVLAFLPRYSKYSPEMGIDAALATLDSVKGNDIRENAVAVWKAGKQLMQFREDTVRLFRQIGLYKPGRMPASFLEKVEDANEASGEALADFNDTKTLLGAWMVCERNRETILLLFVGRSEYDYQKDDAAERFRKVEERFQKITKAAAQIKNDWAKSLKVGSTERKLVELFAQSEYRRSKIIEAMRNDKMNEANQLMWEAIDRAIHTREIVLEMALELEDKTQDWKLKAE